MMAQHPVVHLSFMHPPQRIEIAGVSLPADDTIFLVGMIAIPAVLGWSARRNPITMAILAGLVLSLFAVLQGRFWKAMLSGEPDFAAFGPALWASQGTAYLACFLAAFVARYLWERQTTPNPKVSAMTGGRGE